MTDVLGKYSLLDPALAQRQLNAALASAGGGDIQTATIHLTAADIHELHTTPVEIIPALGAGKYPAILSTRIDFTAGTHLLASNNRGMALKIGAYNIVSVASQFPAENGSSYTSTPLAGNYSLDITSLLNQPVMIQSDANYDFGEITASHVAAGGSGYAPGDTGTLSDDYGDATYVVDTVSGGGAVLTYHLDNPGTGYSVKTQSTNVTTGSGDGAFTINVTSVQLGNGTADVTVKYLVV